MSGRKGRTHFAPTERRYFGPASTNSGPETNMCAPAKEFVPLPRILDLCLTKTLRQPSLRSWLNPLHYNANPAVVWGQEGMIIEVSAETGSHRRQQKQDGMQM